MRSANVTFENLQRVSDGKSEYFVAKIQQKGKALDDYLTEIVGQALKKLLSQADALGDTDHQFVRRCMRSQYYMAAVSFWLKCSVYKAAMSLAASFLIC